MLIYAKIDEILGRRRKMSFHCDMTATGVSQESNDAIDYLRTLLPLSRVITGQIDRATVLRVTTAYLKTKRFLSFCSANGESELIGTKPEDVYSMMLQALDGFCILLSRIGEILYVTETASTHLGYSQVDVRNSNSPFYVNLLGHSFSEFLLPEEWQRFESILEVTRNNISNEVSASFSLNMKCKLPKRNAGILNKGYKSIMCTSFLQFDKQTDQLDTILVYGYTLDKQGSIELTLSTESFLFRMNPELRIVFVETRVAAVLGYNPKDLLDTTFYKIIHADDIGVLEQAHRKILSSIEIQSITPSISLLHQGGGYMNVVVHFVKHFNTTNGIPFTITALCTVIGLSSPSSFVDRLQSLTSSKSIEKKEEKGGNPPIGVHSALFYNHSLSES